MASEQSLAWIVSQSALYLSIINFNIPGERRFIGIHLAQKYFLLTVPAGWISSPTSPCSLSFNYKLQSLFFSSKTRFLTGQLGLDNMLLYELGQSVYYLDLVHAWSSRTFHFTLLSRWLGETSEIAKLFKRASTELEPRASTICSANGSITEVYYLRIFESFWWLYCLSLSICSDKLPLPSGSSSHSITSTNRSFILKENFCFGSWFSDSLTAS